MITCQVNIDMEPVVALRLQGPGGRERVIEATIDTGFNGFLTLPPNLVQDLALRRVSRGRAIVANGARQLFDICAVTVLWDGQPRYIEADSLRNEPLIGMGLLKGHDLLIQVEVGGSVVIEARNQNQPH